jgi:dipeptidyl aminopeptidase/acylaminoacyl peptidase
MIRRVFLAAAAALALPAASPPGDTAAAFGAREAIQQISLSPSGSKIAFIAPGPGQSTYLYTVDTMGGGQPVLAAQSDGNPERLSSCGWVSEERLVCTVYIVTDRAGVAPGEVIGATRLIALDSNGANVKLLSRPRRPDDLYVALSGGDIVDWLPGTDGSVLMEREYVPEGKIGTRLEDKKEGLGVDRIDTRTLSYRPVEPPKRLASGYISDGQGKVRLMASIGVAGATGYASGKTSWYYRKKDDGGWSELAETSSIDNSGFWPVAVDPALDVAYGYRDHEGRVSLFSIALDGSKRETLVFSHPEVDVEGVVRIGRGQRVVGTTYATDKLEAVYFDKELAALARSLAKALPGLPLIRFVDSSADEKKLLLWAGSDTDPGRYFLFDKTAKRLNELMLARPELEGAKLATVKAIRYRAADGTEVPAYLTLPPGSEGKKLPAIVMPHGGPSSRDYWGFDWLPQYFAARGYAVLQPNYRGSAGYGSAWYQQNGFKSWRTAIGDVNDAGRWLVAQGIADPAKLGIFGWSYGGYAALQSNVLDPGLFRAVVAVAPVTDLSRLVEGTRDRMNHRVVRSFIGQGPHVREGSPAQNAERIKAPVLLFHGTHDLNVDVEQARTMHDKLKSAGGRSELVVYPRLDHQLDDAAARTEMLRKSDAFLRAAFGMP